jgi:hypothetical protein
MKLEAQFSRMIALSSKCYYGDRVGFTKRSCKGVNERRNEADLQWNNYYNVLVSQQNQKVTNMGFMPTREGTVHTNVSEKYGLSFLYPKRYVHGNDINSTAPLNV